MTRVSSTGKTTALGKNEKYIGGNRRRMPKRNFENTDNPKSAFEQCREFRELIEQTARNMKLVSFQQNIGTLRYLANEQDSAITKLVVLQQPFRRTEATYILNRIDEKNCSMLERIHHFNKFINFANKHPKDPYPPLIKLKDFVPLTEEENYEFEADVDPEEELETMRAMYRVFWRGLKKTKLPKNSEEFVEFVEKDKQFLENLEKEGKEIEVLDEVQMPDWGNWGLDEDEPARKKAK